MSENYTIAPDITYYDFVPIKTGIGNTITLVSIEKPRSSNWACKRKEIVEKHPFCAVCNSNKNLQVHHIRPFHLWPELELTDENLRVLCQTCHITWGHLGNWKSFNLEVDRDINRIKNRPYIRTE